MKYEDFNCDISNEGFISDAFKKLFGKKKEDTPKKTGVKITRSELRSILKGIDSGLQKDCKALLKSIESKHSEFFKSSPEAITFSHNYKESISGEWDNCIALFYYNLNEVVTPNGKGMARMIFREELPVGNEIETIMDELISGLRPLVDKYFSNNLIAKGIKISADSLGDWDDGDLGFYFENVDVVDVTEGTEALRDIVKKVAKKAADKAGIIPAGSININKNNIKGFHQATRVLLNYGQSRELINRSFKGIDIKKFGSKANLDAFMNSIKPVGKFHVAQGWLIFDLMETDTYKLKNDLNKEDWDNMYDAAEMVTKKANYTTIRIIKELFGSREIELHPNPIGHLLSKNGTKSRLMFKLGKIKIEDGTFENSNDLVDRIRFTIGTESADPELIYEDNYALEDAVESANSDYEFFEAIGIESEMIAITEAFGEIEDLNEMIAIESVGFESSIKNTDTTQIIVDEILNRMEQDPILKLAKDKDLIEIKANPKAKRKISINFKEIKEIEKILTPDDIQKYGGSTYQFLLKLSDTFNKNIMWNMKEIEETAKSGGNNSDTEAVESLKGRGYYIYKGIESLDDLIEEMIMMENGLEDFNEFKDSAKAWIKKAIAIIMDFLSKDKVVYFFQVRNFQDIQKKVNQINEHNMDDYDLYVLGKLSTLFSDLNKSKSYYYRKLKDMNFSDPSEVRISLKELRSVSNKVKERVEAIDNIYDTWKDKYQRNPNRESKKGAVVTVKSTILKMKFEYIDVRQNFLELEKKIEEGALSKTDEEALRAFLNLSKSMQSAYLKGATKAMKMIRKMLYNPEKKPSNESFEGIIEYEINWDWVDIETKGVIGLESKYDPHPLYKGIMDKAEADITKIAKKVAEDILKTPEYKEFKEEVERKAEKDDFLRKHIDEVLKINGNYVESTYTSIELISYDEEVYYMDSWNKLESAIVRELNKYADKVFCRPGYKWVFDKPADDQPQFTAYIKKVSGGNESINDIYTEYIDNIMALESSENSSITNALKVIKNGIISFIKPITPSGRREALKKKEEEQAELAKAREKEAEKLRKREESIKYYKEYSQKALPIAKKEAEKILKTLPKTPEYKALLKEAKEYGEKEGYDALDSVYFFVDGNEYDSICLIGYDQDMFSFDALYKVEDVLIKMLRKIANKIPHPDGFHWDFCGPYDDEACIWMDLYPEGEYAGDESIESGLEYSRDKFRSINSTFKSLKTSALPIVDKISNEVLNDVINSKEYKKLIEINKGFKFEIGDIYDKGDIGSSDRFEVFEMTDTISGVEMSSDVDAFVKLVKSKFRDKISSIPIEDGFKWDIVIHYDKVSSFYCQLYPSYFEGTEDGHIRVLEITCTESEVVQAIYDEFGAEGITSIIKRITSSK